MTRAEELRAEAAALRQRAAVLGSIANVTDAVYAVSKNSDICPGCSCRKCPAYVGHPGVCLFVRLRGVVDAYFFRPKSCDPVIEVP